MEKSAHSSSSSWLRDPRLKHRLQQLRQADNRTNWYYIARAWLLILTAACGTLAFALHGETWGISSWWNAPVFALAIVVIGACQHQLSGLGHEASHHVLFRNRMLNDLASDLLCMYPLFTSTYHYRQQHLAHHQFVNDPERDPDVSQLRASGQWKHFPLSRREAWKMLAAQLWLPNLFRFMRVRALYNSIGLADSPYVRSDDRRMRRRGIVVGLALVGQIVLLRTLMRTDSPALMAAGSLALWCAVAAWLACLPAEHFKPGRIHPTISLRTGAILRMTFLTLLINALAWTSWLSGRWAAFYFLLLWVAPLFTSYAFFMVLRQAVQHGNGDRGMLTNTRVFFMNRLISFCVFPIGQRYHLPHHLFATVPHYRLAQLHDELLAYDDYRQQAIEVENYILPADQPVRRPTVVEVLGPEYAPPPSSEVFIDNSVLEDEAAPPADAEPAVLAPAHSH